MIVAMVTVDVVQVAIYQVVDVIAVGHLGVSAVGTVHVVRSVTFAAVGRASVGIRIGDGYAVLVVVILVGAVQVPVVEVPYVAVVHDGGVAAVRAVGVVVVLVDGVGHRSSR